MFEKCGYITFRKWANRLFINNDFSYTDFLQLIEGNIVDGLWTVELLKVLKSYDFRFGAKSSCSSGVYTVQPTYLHLQGNMTI